MVVNILNTVVLLGFLQGIIFSSLLFFRREKRIEEKLLATLLLLISLASLNIYLSESMPYWQVGVFLSLVPTMLIMAIGPLVYFYLCSMFQASFRWKRNYWIHFLPVIIDVLPIVIGWVLAIGFLLRRFDQDYLLSWGNMIDQYNTYTDIPRWLSITLYLSIARRYYKTVASDLNNKKRSQQYFLWIGRFIDSFLVFLVIWFLFLIFYINPSTRFVVLDNLGYYPIFIPLTVLIYILGIKGYMLTRNRAQVFTTHQSIKLDGLKLEKLEKAIIRSMEEDKLYLDPNLDLKKLVNHVGSDQRTVSYMLNQHFAKSFNAFVNYYRVEEVKQRMVSIDHERLKLSGIAYESGFNSQSTFQRVFKQLTSLSPKEYLLQLNRA